MIAPPTRKDHYKIASIPADGIGIEVVSAAIEVVEQLAKTLKNFTIEFTHFPWGTAYYKEHGRFVDDNLLEVLQSYDATIFGSIGAPGKQTKYSVEASILTIQMFLTTSLSGAFSLRFAVHFSFTPMFAQCGPFLELSHPCALQGPRTLTGF